MLDAQELQVIAQLVDNMEVSVDKIEKSYSDNDAENFKKAKTEINKIHFKIKEMIK